MIRRKSIFAVLLVLLPLPGPASRDDGPADDIRASRLEAYVSVLAADFTRGRETGSEGFDIAAAYAASLFKAWGLQPGGDFPDPLVRLRTGRGRSYFQTVPLVRNAEDPETTMTLTVNRGGFRKELVFRRRTDFDVDASIPFDIMAELVFAGYGSADPDFNEVGNLDIRDKFVIVLDGMPGQTDPAGALYRRTRDARRARMEKIRRSAENGESGDEAGDDPGLRLERILRERGAAGCLIVTGQGDGNASTPAPVQAGWGVNAPFRNLTANAYRMYEGDRPPVKRRPLRLPGGPILAPAGGSDLFRNPGGPLMITVTPGIGDALLAHTGRTLDGLRRGIDASGRPSSFALAGPLLRVRNTIRTESVNGTNVIGVVPGSDPVLKDEIILVGAHLAHIGAYNNVIYNGADDNASGAAAVLELARTFSSLSVAPKRTVVFGLWCGEEDGFLGTRYFSDRPYAPLARIVTCLNMDMIGRLPMPGIPPGGKLVVHTSCQTPLLKQIAQECVQSAGLEADFIEEKIEGLAGSGGSRMDSDHVALAARGIGFIYMETGVHEDWHGFLDHADKINAEGMEKIARAAFLAIKRIADLDRKPDFDKSIPVPKRPNRFRLVAIEDAEKASPPTSPVAMSAPKETVAAPSGGKASEGGRTIRLVFDLLGKSDDSRFEGTVAVSSGGRTIFDSDTIILRGFRQERVYTREFDIAGVDLAKEGLDWEIGGTLYDSALKDSLTIAYRTSRTFVEPFKGIGFRVSTAAGRLEISPETF